MTLQQQFENAGSTVRYVMEENGKINFLTSADTYEQFKTLLEIVEVQVVNESYNRIDATVYSGGMYNGSIII